MKNDLPMDQRINELMKKKMSVCQCDPCTCPKETKESYFHELKDIVKSYNTKNFPLSIDNSSSSPPIK
ncbi:MAG TPA: hypothetical protein DHV28_17475 [Ignavibacteriales bacterium]|nr:hypothetical protein [Ignavibacteriales bacterium]